MTRWIGFALCIFGVLLAVCLALNQGHPGIPATVSANDTTTSRKNVKQDQELPLTYGGFLKDGPKTERIAGTCRPDDSRTILDCDLYNGLPGWTLTEVTLAVTWVPYEKDDVRYYKVPVVIRPLTTESVAVKLGLQLPPDDFFGKRRFTHWSWQNLGAKGYPTE